MSSAKQLQHRRTHNLILISKLLSCRENASPLTLVIDTLEQRANPLVHEMMRRANVSKIHIIYVSYSTLQAPKAVDAFIQASTLSIPELQKKITSQISQQKRSLILIDNLHPLLLQLNLNVPAFFSALTSPTTSLLLTFHMDIPIYIPGASILEPHPLTLLRWLATTVIQVHSLHHVLAQKAARERSHAEPVFGLQEETEGVIVGLGANDDRGVVIEMEYRRKSGRGVREWFFLPARASPTASSKSGVRKPAAASRETVILLEDHPFYSRPVDEASQQEGGETETTFNLNLTEKQRRDRDGIVLPYFDAQGDGEVGEGGRILYDMGEEDDFDEEEDEI